MKKRIGAILVAGVVACSITASLALSGCTGGVKPDFVMPEEGFDVNSTVTIRFYHSMGAKLRDILDYHIAEFNKIYPNIRVEHQTQGDYDGVHEVIGNEIVAGNQPNIAYCYPDHVADYNTSLSVQPLDDFLPGGAYADYTFTRQDGVEVTLGLTQEEVDMFNPNYYEEGYKFGDETKMYTLPWIKSTEAMYYNADFFANNGYEVPTTWDELEAFCIDVKANHPEIKYPFTYDSEANWFITMCEQYGSDYTSATGKKYLFDNETNRAFVAKFADWYQKGYFTTQSLNGDTYTSGLFTAQDSVICIGSTGGASYQTDTSGESVRFKVGIAQIPQVDPVNNPKVISQGPSVCIFKSDNPQEVIASWLFVKYFTTNVDFQAEFSSESGYMPVLKPEVMETNATYASFLAKYDDPNYLTALAIKVGMEHATSYYVSPAFMGSSEARTQVGLLMAAAFNNPTQIDAAFKNAVSRCEYLYA